MLGLERPLIGVMKKYLQILTIVVQGTLSLGFAVISLMTAYQLTKDFAWHIALMSAASFLTSMWLVNITREDVRTEEEGGYIDYEEL